MSLPVCICDLIRTICPFFHEAGVAAMAVSAAPLQLPYQAEKAQRASCSRPYAPGACSVILTRGLQHRMQFAWRRQVSFTNVAVVYLRLLANTESCIKGIPRRRGFSHSYFVFDRDVAFTACFFTCPQIAFRLLTALLLFDEKHNSSRSSLRHQI